MDTKLPGPHNKIRCSTSIERENSDRGCTRSTENLVKLWPECVIVNGRPRHPESQGSIERSNHDIEHMLQGWMFDNDSKQWTVGLPFVQWQKNSLHHRTIGRSPYRALFGFESKLGFASTSIPLSIAKELQREEELEDLLATENEMGIQVMDVEPSPPHDLPETSSAMNDAVQDCELPGANCCICSKSILNVEEVRVCAECCGMFHFKCHNSVTTTTIENDSSVCPLCAQQAVIAEEQLHRAKRIKLAADKLSLIHI